jgi:hypothetical protein
MRNSEQIRSDYRTLKNECIQAITELIKQTGKDEYEFQDAPNVAYWNGWGDGWQCESISKICLNPRGEISLILTGTDYDLDWADIHHAEWVYILEQLESELLNQ